MKEKNKLEENEHYKIQVDYNDSNEIIYKLTIINCKKEDVGQYIAKVKNPLGEVTTQSKLNILYGPTFLKELATEYLVKEHEVTKMTVEITGNPKPEVTWAKEVNSELLPISIPDDRIKIEQQQNLYSLTIKDSLLKDACDYICVAKNTISEVSSKAKVNITIPPKFLVQPESNKEVELGQNIELKCTLRGFPLPEIKLFDSKNQEKISKEDELVISSNILNETEVEYIFSFISINSDTSSSYECKATNKAGEVNVKFNLNILRKPEFIKQPDELIRLLENSELLLSVIVFASPDATIAWFKDSNKLSASKRIQLVDDKSKTAGPKTFSLKIPSANKDDVGLYEMVATNKLGEARVKSTVTVEFGPVIVKDLKAKERGTEGKEFAFEAIIKAIPQPEVKWYVNLLKYQ